MGGGATWSRRRSGLSWTRSSSGRGSWDRGLSLAQVSVPDLVQVILHVEDAQRPEKHQQQADPRLDPLSDSCLLLHPANAFAGVVVGDEGRQDQESAERDC